MVDVRTVKPVAMVMGSRTVSCALWTKTRTEVWTQQEGGGVCERQLDGFHQKREAMADVGDGPDSYSVWRKQFGDNVGGVLIERVEGARCWRAAGSRVVSGTAGCSAGGEEDFSNSINLGKVTLNDV